MRRVRRTCMYMHTRRKHAGLAPRGAIGACSFFKLYTAAPLLHEIHAVAAHARHSICTLPIKARTLAPTTALCQLTQGAPGRDIGSVFNSNPQQAARAPRRLGGSGLY